MGKVSIIIVTYNGIQWIEKCLNSILPIYDIIVVDNNSNDNTLEVIRMKFPRVKIIPQSKNLGFGQANNIGISEALKNGAAFIYLLNQDAYLNNNTINTLIEAYTHNKEFGILSPIHLNGTGTKLDVNFSYYVRKNKTLLFDALTKNFEKDIYSVPFVNAAGWLLPKSTLERIGGFDPIFFHYGEDDNFCQRVLYHKLKIGVVPMAYMKHDREEREVSTIKTEKDYLKYIERKYKCEIANINRSFKGNLKSNQKTLFKALLKFMLKLNFKLVKRTIKEINLINKIVPEIIKSRTLNMKQGSPYLNLLSNK